MPPKKDKKKKDAIVIDGVDTSEMTREQLEQFTMRVKDELDREREERNLFQVERDKIRTFWEISRCQLEELRAEIRNKEREREEGAEAAEQAAATHAQRVKHLSHEHAGDTCALRADAQASLQHAYALHGQQLMQLGRDKRDLRAQLREQDTAAREELRKLNMMHQEELKRARKLLEEKCHEQEAAAERRLAKVKADAEVVHRADVAEVEERKSAHITVLVKAHESAFTDLKDYYNEITLNNLGLISNLKAQAEEAYKLRERAEAGRAQALAGKKQLAEPLEKALTEAAELRRRAHHADQDRAMLANKIHSMATLEKKYETLKWEHEVLQQKYSLAVAAREEVETRFTTAVQELHQRASLKGALLEQRLYSAYGSATRAIRHP